MPPKKELCRNFQRGSCQYGDRCKFLHVTQQQQRQPNNFTTTTNTQFQRPNVQQQRPNPFGFGVQPNSQSRGGPNDFGSKQNNQFKPFENKWTRFSPLNGGGGGSQASRQPDNQHPAANHDCTDPQSCKRQITEDFEHERPLWKLTCYGHNKSSPCDVNGDISCEELRAAAYDDSKRGLSLQSIVERERNLLNAKLLEFESLLRNPYVIPQNSVIANQSPFSGATPTPSVSSMPPSVSSFSQLGASLNMGPGMRPATPPNNAFGSIPNSSQTSGIFGNNNLPFGSAGSLGSQLHNQSFGNSFASNPVTFGNSAISAKQNPFSTFAAPPQIPSLASVQSPVLPNGQNSASTAVGQLSVNVDTMPATLPNNAFGSIPNSSQTTGIFGNNNVDTIGNMVRENGTVDNSIWLKQDWNPGEIPEEAPPDAYIF